MLDLSTSSTYQEIFAQGEAKGLAKGEAKGIAKGEREMLLLFGSKKLGPPEPATAKALKRITDPERLKALADRLFQVESWDDLLKQ